MLHRSRLLALAAVMCCASPALADSVTINGVTRTFTARLPATKGVPLVIVLHGNTQTGEDMMTRTAWPAVADGEDVCILGARQ